MVMAFFGWLYDLETLALGIGAAMVPLFLLSRWTFDYTSAETRSGKTTFTFFIVPSLSSSRTFCVAEVELIDTLECCP